jgi:hypothetical protein
LMIKVCYKKKKVQEERGRGMWKKHIFISFRSIFSLCAFKSLEYKTVDDRKVSETSKQSEVTRSNQEEEMDRFLFGELTDFNADDNNQFKNFLAYKDSPFELIQSEKLKCKRKRKERKKTFQNSFLSLSLSSSCLSTVRTCHFFSRSIAFDAWHITQFPHLRHRSISRRIEEFYRLFPLQSSSGYGS